MHNPNLLPDLSFQLCQETPFCFVATRGFMTNTRRHGNSCVLAYYHPIGARHGNARVVAFYVESHKGCDIRTVKSTTRLCSLWNRWSSSCGKFCLRKLLRPSSRNQQESQNERMQQLVQISLCRFRGGQYLV